MKVLFYIATTAAVLCASAHAGDPLAMKWDSNPLDVTQQRLESELKDATAQGEINQITGTLAEVADAKLMIAYLHLYSLLSPQDQSKISSEQTHWLKLRIAAAKEASQMDDGGSAAPMDAYTEFTKFTDKRRVELEKRLVTLIKATASAKGQK